MEHLICFFYKFTVLLKFFSLFSFWHVAWNLIVEHIISVNLQNCFNNASTVEFGERTRLRRNKLEWALVLQNLNKWCNVPKIIFPQLTVSFLSLVA